MLTHPFIGSLLMRCRVELTEAVPTAAVDGGNTIYVNPQWASNLNRKDLLTVMAHEALHLALRHGERAKAVGEKRVYNFVADAVVNHILGAHGLTPLQGSVTMDTVKAMLAGRYNLCTADLEKLSTEALYRLVMDCLPSFKGFTLRPDQPDPQIGEDLRPDLGFGPSKSAEKSGGGAEGSKEVLGGGAYAEGGWDDYWRDAINKAYVAAKMAGRLPAGIERFFEVIKPKVDWRSILRESLITGMGMKAVSTYHRPSRKHPELPGLKRFSISSIWVLADMSASIGDKEVSQFASEVFAIAKTFNTTVKVIPWDTQPYEITVLRSPSDIHKLKFRGGGGTVIKSTLEKLMRGMDLYDSVVILTDGFIGDIDRADVQAMLEKIAHKASATIFVTTANKPKLPNKWTVVEMD
jgi:predicted metal-dependent peptidase